MLVMRPVAGHKELLWLCEDGRNTSRSHTKETFIRNVLPEKVSQQLKRCSTLIINDCRVLRGVREWKWVQS